jgi:hypothetical protein
MPNRHETVPMTNLYYLNKKVAYFAFAERKRPIIPIHICRGFLVKFLSVNSDCSDVPVNPFVLSLTAPPINFHKPSFVTS